MSLPTPNYKTVEDYKFTDPKDVWGEKVLPAGTFVRPIAIQWLPNHVLESQAYRWFDKEKEVFVYSHMGIVAIPKRIVRRV